MSEAARRAAEVFHLTFLGALGTRLDRKLYAVKGGCNLRFFFGSPRYSEDLDLDVRAVAVGTLRSKVERLLRSAPLSLHLAAHGLVISDVSSPKQTDTTQRWKLQVEGGGFGSTRTKIEFSRRGTSGDVEVASPDPTLLGTYRLSPALVPHYTGPAALHQKIQALAGRREAQARDVFDLDLLLRGGVRLPPELAGGASFAAAAATAERLTFDDFLGQVAAYLPDEVRDTHDRAYWEGALGRVRALLEGGGAR